MTSSSTTPAPARAVRDRCYEIRLTGLVPEPDLLPELGEQGHVEHEMRTVLSGTFADQAALHAFLHRLRALGLEVVEVRRVGTHPGDARADS